MKNPNSSWRRAVAVMLSFAALILANPARAVDCSEANEGRVVDTITAIDQLAGTLTVGTQQLRTDGETEYLDLDNNPIPFASFGVGEIVEAEWCIDSGTPPIATKISREDAVNGTELRGFIATVDASNNSFVLGGVTVTTTGATEFLDDDNNPIGFGSFVVGLFVEAEGQLNATGDSLNATKVKIEDDDGDDNFSQELRGIIETIDPVTTQLTVAGRLVTTAIFTEYLDRNNNPMNFADLVVGQFVEVEGGLIASGALLASKIKLEDPPVGVGGGVEFRSLIGSIDPINQSLVVGATAVTTNATTAFLGRQNQAIAFGDLQVGMFVEVEGVLQANGVVAASKIKIEDRVVDEVANRGAIESLSAASVTVGGRTYAIVATTLLLDVNNVPTTIETFLVGQLVEVEGVVEFDGSFTATKMKREDNPNACVSATSFSGVTSQIDVPNSRLLVGETTTVVITAQTRLTNPLGFAITLADVPTGAVAEVSGNFTTATSLTACELRLRVEDTTNDLGNTRVFGLIASIDAPALSFTTDLGQVIVTDVTTVFVLRRQDQTSTAVTFADLAVGTAIQAEGRRLIDGRFAAVSVTIADENRDPANNSTHRLGAIRAIGAGTIDLDDGTVIDTTGGLSILTIAGTEGTINDLHVGAFVAVTGTLQGTGTLLASTIEMRGAVIAEINQEAATFLIGATTIVTNGATVFTEVGGSSILLTSLVLGDTVDVVGTLQIDGTILATTVTRIQAGVLSGPVFGLTSTINAVDRGRPIITMVPGDVVYGFAQTAMRAYPVQVNSLYRVDARVATSVADRNVVPTLRLRLNNQSFLKGYTFEIYSNQGANFSPNPIRDYSVYYAPAVDPANVGQTQDGWFFSLDAINVQNQDQADASFALEKVTMSQIPVDRIRVAQTLFHTSFGFGSNGWTNGGAPGLYDVPAARSGAAGTLDLSQDSANGYGFWSVDTRVAAQANALYRARFLVRTTETNPDLVSTLRFRLNLSSFQLAAVGVTDSVVAPGSGLQANEAPTGTARLYDVYLPIPGDPNANDTILASFDLVTIGQAGTDTNRTVSLDEFRLERVEVVP